MDEQITNNPGGTVTTYAFAQDVARYFKTFLETGLRTSPIPARRMSNTRFNGLLTQLQLDKYPQLHKNLYKNMTSGLVQEAFVVSQNKYITHIDERVSDIFSRNVASLDRPTSTTVAKAVAHAIDSIRIAEPSDFNSYVIHALEASRTVMSNQVVSPIIREVYNGVVAESELSSVGLQQLATDKLYAAFEGTLTAIITDHFIDQKDPETLLSAVQHAFSVEALQSTLRDFLSELSMVDAYQEIYALHRSNVSLVNTDLYLYFGDISIRGFVFPLFYTVLKTQHTYPSVTIGFEDRIFVNTRALEYVLKEYSQIMGTPVQIKQKIEQLLYIDAKNRKDLLPRMQAVVDTLLAALSIDTPLKLESPTEQSVTNLGVRLTNRQRLVVFDKSNESLVRDYEEILAQTSSKPAQDFTGLLNTFVLDSPTQYVEEVTEEWNAKSSNEKLLSNNPLPLNDEQKQVLISLSKKDCNVVVVKGAPGTGKTHLVSSVVAQSFMDGKSALVLSRSPAALDAVQRKITGVLDNVRGKRSYHNPLLRLNQTNDELLEEVEEQFIQKLMNYHQTYMRLQPELVTNKARKVKDAAEVLQGILQGAENINLQEVEQAVNNEVRFGNRDWLHDESMDEMSVQLPRLHQAVQYIRSSDANYLLPFIESSQQKAIADFIGAIREYEKSMKSVSQREPEFIVRYRKLLPEQQTRLQSALSYIHSNFRQYIKVLRADSMTTRLGITDNVEYETVVSRQNLLEKLIAIANDAKAYARGDRSRTTALMEELISYQIPAREVTAAITTYIEQVISLKSKIFGFSGRTLVVENLTRQLKKAIPQFALEEPEHQLDELQQMVDITEFTVEQLSSAGLDLGLWKEVLQIVIADNARVRDIQKIIASFAAPADFEFMLGFKIFEADNLLANISLLEYATQLNNVLKANPALLPLFGIKNVGQVLAKPQTFRGRFDKLATDLDDVKHLDDNKQIIKQFIKSYPDLARRLGVQYTNASLDVIDDTFAETSTEDVKEYLAFKKKEQDIVVYFKEMTTDTYSRSLDDIRQITATQISHAMDVKLLEFIQQHADSFNAIKAALKSKQQISPNLFKGLQQFFPVVLSEIRDYATYLPLKRDLFDMVIIDEASGVSIAEALPALLRAKKILVLGEGETLTGAVASEVNITINDMHRNRAIGSLLEAIQDLPADAKNRYVAQVKQNFDVTHSVLQFAESVANHKSRLTKYFRSSSEIISYVNKQFYGDKLKCLKARNLPINEIIKLDQIRPASELPISLHTNMSEVHYLIEVLTQMKDANYEGSIGIITPYHEQAVLIQKELDECVISDWFAKRELKVMTFDTCEGEERDYVLYSMVSSRAFNHHQYIFPAGLTVDTLPMHRERLLVGLSRAREIVHFITSIPIDSFWGEPKNVLMHYYQQLGSSTPKTNTVSDILMAAESLVPQYFYATKFYKKHADRMRLVTQFSLGDYLKPLSPKSVYPSYKVDFLIVYDDQQIVLTFDEFKENFLSAYVHSKDLYTNYLSPQDIYNQKVLESYGYKFIRLNKFNLGFKPVEVLDRLLNEVTKVSHWPRDNGFLN